MSSIWRKTYRVVGFMLGLGAAVAHAGAPADNTLFFLTPTLNSWNGGRIEMRVTKNTNHPSAGVTVITGVSFWYNATTPSQTGATPVAKMTLTSGAFDSKPIVLTIDPAFYIIAKVDYTKGGMADTITLGDTGINPSYGAHLIKVDNEPPKPATIKWIGLNFPDVAAPDDRYYRDYDFWKGFSKDRLFWSVPQSKYNAAGQPWYYQVKAESTYGTDPQQMTRLYVCSYHIPINWVESDIPTLPPQDYTAADADGVNPAFVKEARTPAYLRDASDGTGSGIAGVIIEVGQKPPNTYTVGTTVTTNYRAKTDVYLNNGETTSNTTAYWIATTTIDNAGNRAETLHFGPIWFVKSPAILCPGNQTASTGPANCTYTHSGTAWDPTPGPETTMALTYQYTLSGAGGVPATGSSLNGVTFNKGVTTVEWIGYDHCGNASNTCTFTVTIADHVPPTITCPSNLNNVPADAGECYATGLTLGTPSVWDNCGIEPGYPVNNAPTQFPLGTTIVTWTVMDTSGNTATCQQSVTVTDQQDPDIVCPATKTVSANANCQYTLGDYRGEAVTDDNCDPAVVVTQSPVPGTVVGIGDTTVTLRATDDAGNSSQCSFIVRVVDTTVPTISCPANEEVPGDADCEAILGDYRTSATVDDNCDALGVTVSQNPAPGTSFSGTVTVTLTATDAAGNHASCQFTVTVIDDSDPEISCPADKTVSADANCEYALGDYTGEATTDDNCDDDVEVTQSPAPGTVVGLGDTTVTLTATDDAGNQDTCSFTVTVEDTSDPTISCPADKTVSADANCEYALGSYCGEATADDNCDGDLDCVQTPSPGTVIGLGDTTVTLTVTDDAGNSASCSFTVTVVDDTDPTISCPPDDEVAGDADCGAILGDYRASASVHDNCGRPTVTQDPAPGTSFSGCTDVTLTVEDGAGNTASCTFKVCVVDETDPTISCPADDEVPGDANCQAVLGDYTDQATTDDNCDDDVEVTQSPAPGYVFSGMVEVTLTATDDTGNTDSCFFYVFVTDETDPTITCPEDKTVSADSNCEFKLPDYTGEATVDDNCDDDVEVTQSPAPGTVIGLGPQTVTLTAEDDAGNTASCSFTVTVVDDTDPNISCPTAVAPLSADDNCEALLPDYCPNATAYDNCDGDLDCAQSPAAGTAVGLGTTTVTLTVTDDAGNSASCSFVVTVIDDTDPTITCPADKTVSADANCEFELPDYTGEATVDDNCDDDVVVTQMPAPGTMVGLGTTTVTLRATDDTGNWAECSFTVTVADTTPPSLVCPVDETVSADDACEYVLPDYCARVTASDYCDADLDCEQSPAAGTVLGLGDTTVTLTVTDDAGNSASCSFTVTVVDDADPLISCPRDVTVPADANCEYELPDYCATVIASDNCDADLDCEQDPPAGTKIGLGATLVTLTVTDDTGNSASCSFTVTVEDDTDPTITCPADKTVSADANCEFELPDYTGEATVDDNCDDDVVVTQMPAPGTMVGLGTTTVTLTATDNAGNWDSCSFTVTVVDDTDPTIICPPNDEVPGDANCEAILGDYRTGASVDDNCGTQAVEVTQTPAPGTTFSACITITLTAEDAAGNTASCTFQVCVIDETDPNITCPVRGDELTADENCEAALPDYTGDATVDDNCDDDVAVTQSPAPGTIISGSVLVTLTATDDAGNTSSCEFTVTVVDETGPEFTQCPDDVTISCLNNTYEFTVCAEDNCGVIDRFEGTIGGVPVTFPTPTGGCATLSYPFPAGDSEVVVTAYDDAGNASSTCTFTVTVENTLSLEVLSPKCKEDLTEYNTFEVMPVYGCEPLVQLIFVVCFDATRLEYRPPCLYTNGGSHLMDSDVVLLDNGASDGIGELLVRYDSPSGQPAAMPTFAPITFQVVENAPDGEAKIDVCQVVFITGADGKERRVSTSGTSVTVGGCVSTLDVSGDGCVTELDGLIIYRVLKYGQFNGLVPIVPPMERMLNCNLPPDEWLIAQVMALVTLPPTVDLNVDDNAGSWDDAVINAARDAVYIYRYLLNYSDPSLADLIVPTAHTDTYLVRATILANIQALDDRCPGGTGR